MDWFEKRKEQSDDDPVQDFIDGTVDDGICPECDGTGELHGHLCKACGGLG